jgi:hypothetical protein
MRSLAVSPYLSDLAGGQVLRREQELYNDMCEDSKTGDDTNGSRMSEDTVNTT